MQEVDKLVRQLNAGALPVPLMVLSSSVVGPTLGQESIDKSFTAGLIGFGLAGSPGAAGEVVDVVGLHSLTPSRST